MEETRREELQPGYRPEQAAVICHVRPASDYSPQHTGPRKLLSHAMHNADWGQTRTRYIQG